MDSKTYYEQHKEELLKIFYDLEQTPHDIVKDASDANLDIYDYILMINDIDYKNLDNLEK